MLLLRLFNRNDLTNQVDSRPVEEGDLVIGRDNAADWKVEDPDRAMSRKHLVVTCRGGLVTVRDTSSNGVFLGHPRQRIERDRPTPVSRGEAIHFGPYVLMLEDVAAAPTAARRDDAPFVGDELLRGGAEASQGRRQQPFGAALKPDPLAERSPVADEDAWDRRREPEAGSWEATGRQRPEHNQLIGSPRQWEEPAKSQSDAGFGFDAPFNRPILEAQPADAGAAVIPTDWMDPTPAPTMAEPEAAKAIAPDPFRPSPPEPGAVAETASTRGAPGQGTDDTLFLHFCAGAGLRPDSFAGDDRAEMMERAGAVYRQAVLGIADLMQERTALRNEYRMVHTTVRPDGNNPFKWVPPQRIAVELLRAEGGGYTTGDRALNEALHDLKAHLLCMLAGMRAALTTTFDALSPAAAEARVPERSYLIKAQRDAALWAEYTALSEQLRAEAEDSSEGIINRAFRQAYEAQAAELHGRGRRT